jgi:hypothetical protein
VLLDHVGGYLVEIVLIACVDAGDAGMIEFLQHGTDKNDRGVYPFCEA